LHGANVSAFPEWQCAVFERIRAPGLAFPRRFNAPDPRRNNLPILSRLLKSILNLCVTLELLRV
jgi:hypothetical protein